MKTWTRDRWGWGLVPEPFTNIWPDDGPWHTEPDKAQWIDKATNLDCLAVRGRSGAWCGYVGVPPGHPYHGLDVMDLWDKELAHGGLNYTAACDEDSKPFGVCHIPRRGRPKDVWWLGFDCGHLFEIKPLMMMLEEHEAMLHAGTYVTFDGVRALVADLAERVNKEGRKDAR
jgi:hypothetical protein